MDENVPPQTQPPVQVQMPAQPVPLPPPNQKSSWMLKFQKLLAQNKTGSIFLGCCILFALGTTVYYIVSPATKAPTLFLPAQQIPTQAPVSNQAPLAPTATPIPPTPTVFAVTSTPIPTWPVAQTPTPTSSPTAGWITYPNTSFGYSIQYPSNWVVMNLGQLEPLIPNYIVFNPNTASTSARSITISVSNRTYEDQLLISGANGQPITAGGLTGVLQNLQDSDGNTSISVILPRNEDLLIFSVNAASTAIFNQMLTTLQSTQ